MRLLIRNLRIPSALIVATVLIAAFPSPGRAFSVLAHQAVVDQSWQSTLVPMIKKRFPNVTDDELNDARSYARAGSHVADLGYFPLGNKLFTDLLHYVRSGDFVGRMLKEANTPKEYAFALGALAHYQVDSIGHPEATNRAVPIIYPKLRDEHGDVVTYAESPSAHLQTEFRFDVLQVARRGEIPGLFEHSIEFKVPKDFLDKEMRETYGLKLDDLFENFDVALTTYRWAFRTLINETTGIAWQLYRGDIESLEPGIAKDKFLPTLSREDFEKEFGKAFEEPGFFVRFVGIVGNLFPNIGPFKNLPYKPLPDEVKKLYAAGFQHAANQYYLDLAMVRAREEKFPNLTLDTGKPSRAGDYEPADKAYAELLRRHADSHFANMPKELAADVANHFRNRDVALKSLSDDDRQKTETALNDFQSTMQHGGAAQPQGGR